MSPNGGLEPPLPRGHLQMGTSFHLSKGDLSWDTPKRDISRCGRAPSTSTWGFFFP